MKKEPAGPVLDASALLAFLNGEPGAARVADALSAGAAISAVNLAEVLAKLADRGQDPAEVLRELKRRSILGLALTVHDFDEQTALEAARVRQLTRSAGLSFADRACLALARRHGSPALTTDQKWGGVDVGVDVQLIR